MKKKLISIILGMLLIATVITVMGTENIQIKIDSKRLEKTDDWLMLGHDAGRTGFSTSDGPESNNLLFNQSISAYCYSGVTAAEGKIYASSHKTLYCIDASTGDIIFDFYCEFSNIYSAPAFNDDRIFFGSFLGVIYCLNASDGSEIWTFDAGGNIITSPALYDDKLYFGTIGDEMICIDTDGNEIWRFTTPTGNYAFDPAVENDKVYFGSTDKNVYCLDANNGNLIWNYLTGGTILKNLCVDDNKVYVVSADDMMYSINAENGSVIWSIPMNLSSETINRPSVHDGKVYFGAEDTKFFCIDGDTGIKLWNYTTSDMISSSSVIADGKVYFGDWSSNIYCLDISDGNEIWIYNDTISLLRSEPAVYNGILYAAVTGELYAFGSNNSPQTPSIPDGPTDGYTDIEYTYSTSATDPDGDQIYYKWDFGDGTTEWFGPFNSGDEVETSHTWISEGTYDVKVKSKDIYSWESGWSDVLSVTIIKTSPELSIESITGGIGVTTIIKNTGDADATNVNYKLTVTGGILNLININVTDIQTNLAIDEEIVITTGTMLGLGSIQITITTTCDEGSSDEETVDGIQVIVLSIVS